MKTRACLLIIIVANAFGNVLLSYGMRQAGGFSLRAAANPHVLAGVGLLILFFLAHMTVLSWADLSYVLTITSVGYILVTLLSWWLLGESVRPARWVGAVCITGGVALVGRTPVATSRKSWRSSP